MSTKWVTWMAVCFALLVSGAAFAVDSNKYHGGSYDGHDLAIGDYQKLDGTAFVITLAKYHGGSYDGYAMVTSASDIPLGVPPAFAGTVTLVNENPPLTWNYLLTRNSGNVTQWTYMGNGITEASVDGDAQAAGWFVHSRTATQVVFATPTPLTGSLTGFHITGIMEGAGQWTCGANSGGVDGPVPVELSSFVAIGGDGEVVVHWTTQTETENLGFHVYRSLRKEGTYEKRTAALIEGAGSSRTTRTYHFVDREVQEGMTYFYKLEDVDFGGNTRMHGPVGVMVTKARPLAFALAQNLPNPFNASTEIRYTLAEEGDARLVVYNMAGQLIRTLVDESQEAGEHTVYWDGRDASGAQVSTGVYFYALEVEGFSAMKRMALLR